MELYTQVREHIADLQSCFIDFNDETYARTPSPSEWRRASRLVHKLNLLCLELYGYANACRQYNVVSIRERLSIVPGKEDEEKNRQSKPLKFTKKEIESMPVQYKKLFFSENTVAHIRIRKDNLYEIRCQLGKKRITATSKSLATAKKKFIYNLHQHVGIISEETKAPCITFEEYALKWLETVKRPVVKDTTFADYENLFKVHLLPTFGSVPLNEISRQDAQDFLNRIDGDGKHRASHKLKQILTSVFEYAVADGILDKTPMQMIRLPIYESVNGVALTKEEEMQFVSKCLSSETLSGKAFLFILYAGLRRSELASARIVGPWIEVKTAKVRKGKQDKNRRIPISPLLRKVLPNVESELPTFQALYLNRLGRTFKEWMPNHHLHELRHTFITRAQECGIPREVVSVWAGHKADNTMTTNVYTHFSEEFQLDCIKKFDYTCHFPPNFEN